MEDDHNPLMCFQHCDESSYINCLGMPKMCPLCQGDLFTTPLLIPPYRLESPIVHSAEVPYSIVIIPNNSDGFLRNYSDSVELHVGVTDSRGAVFSYNANGVKRKEDGWYQCIAVPILGKEDYKEHMMWDIKLSEITTHSKWTASNYKEDGQNCYDFVIAFLRLMDLTAIHPALSNRSQFTKELIDPEVENLNRYLKLYHEVQQTGCVIKPSESSTTVVNDSSTQL